LPVTVLKAFHLCQYVVLSGTVSRRGSGSGETTFPFQINASRFLVSERP